MTTFLEYTIQQIGRNVIFCNDKIPQIILLNGLVGLPYIVMTKVHKYITEWIGWTTIYFIMTTFLKQTTQQIGRTTIFYNDKIPQIYY